MEMMGYFMGVDGNFRLKSIGAAHDETTGIGLVDSRRIVVLVGQHLFSVGFQYVLYESIDSPVAQLFHSTH